jgi:hypothetical protein
MITKVRVQSGQYEQACTTVEINHKTERGLARRIKQLRDEYAVYGDNWAGWIKAKIAIAHDDDKFYSNQIIGGKWCEPVNGWIDFSQN